MNNYLNDKQLVSTIPYIFCNTNFNIFQLNNTAKKIFTQHGAGTKNSLVEIYKFEIVNLTNQQLLDILSVQKKWTGTVSLCFDGQTLQYFSSTINLVILKSKKYLIIQFKKGKSNKALDSDLLFNNHFKKILNASNEGYALMDKNYIIVSINKRAQDIARITHGQLMQLGHSMFEYLPKEAHPYCISVTEKVLSGEKVNLTSEYPGLNGRKTYLCTDYLPAYDNLGEVSGVIIHTVDISEQYYSRKKLEETALQMQSVLSSTSEGITLIGLDYKVLLYNYKMDVIVKTIFKIKTGGKIGADFLNYVLPDRRGLILQIFDRVIAGEKIELQQQFRDKWLLASYTPLRDSNKKVIAVCISLREITDIIDKQIEIEHRQLLYNTTLNNIGEAVILLDNNFVVQHINKEAEVLFQLINLSVKESVKFSLSNSGFKMVNVEDNHLLNLNNWKKISNQEKDILLYQVHKGSKKTFLANISVVKGENKQGEILQYVLSIRDISKIEKMSEMINHLSLIAKNISNGVILSDANGYVQWVNKAFTNITEYKFEDIIGLNAAHMLEGAETNPEIAKKIKNIKINKLPFICEVLNYKKSGEKFWVELSVQPILDKAGKLIQVYFMQSDVTKRKQLEKQLEDERKQNQQNITRAIYTAYEEERSFLSKELHDSVNQKITASIFNLTKLKNNNPEKSELLQGSLELLKESMSEIRSLSRKLIAKELLHFTFEEAIKQMVHSSTMAFPDLKCNIKIAQNCDKEISDELKVNVFRIIQEQLQNIIKHSKATKVSIKADITKDNYFELLTTDNGKGFNLKTKKNGIGLINIFNRVESFNGIYNVVSSSGKGCQFIILFPLK